MKKLSFAGLLLGSMLGMMVALVFGKWLLWLGIGLVIGLFIGSSYGRRHSLESTAMRHKLSA
jgi:hypothetical protein